MSSFFSKKKMPSSFNATPLTYSIATPLISPTKTEISPTLMSPISVANDCHDDKENAASGNGNVATEESGNESLECGRESPSRFRLREVTDSLKTQTLARLNRKRIRSCERSVLYSGASFKGEQRSGRSSYEVSVEIQVCVGCACVVSSFRT